MTRLRSIGQLAISGREKHASLSVAASANLLPAILNPANPMSTPKEVLYWSGTMLDNAPDLDPQLQATATSGFTTIMLWSLHVNTPIPSKDIVLGDLTWNDTPLVSTKTGKPVFDPTGSFKKLAGRLNTLLASGKVKRLFFSIGSEGTDFATIKELYSMPQGQVLLLKNFATVLDSLPKITGFDFDVEDCFDVPSTAWLTGQLASKVGVSYCPSGDLDDFWEPCLESLYQSLKKQPVEWCNLQCYSGGSTQDPLSWMSSIKQNQKKNGVASPSTFIVPGYAANNKVGDGPGIFSDVFTSRLTRYKGKVGGAFVWNSQHIFDDSSPCKGKTATVQDYAAAINKALQ